MGDAPAPAHGREATPTKPLEVEPVAPLEAPALVRDGGQLVAQAGAAAGAGNRHPGLRPVDLMLLQRMAGNQAVSALVGGPVGSTRAGRPAASLQHGEAAPVTDRGLPEEPSVQRDGGASDADRAWAEDARTKIRSVMDEAASASDRLSGDARTALTALRATQTSYIDFEGRYNAAADRFTSSVKKALEDAQALRDNVKFVASTALTFSLPAKLVEIGGKVGDTLERIDKTAKLVGAPAPPGPPEVKVGPSSEVDWKGLLQATIDTFDKYLAQNQSLSAIGKAARTQDRWLTDVIEGTVTGEGLRASAAGAKATETADGAAAARADLATIRAPVLSSAPVALASDVSGRLDKVTGEKMEQDIALKWISGLSRDQLDAIDDADDYLARLGVIDKEGSRTGVSTGGWTTEWDEMLIWIRSQVETLAQQQVGQQAEWLGGSRYGDLGVSGEIRAGDGGHWHASGPSTLSEQGGGLVTVNSYSIAPLGDEASNWEHPSEQMVRQLLLGKVNFRVSPIGPTGGGAAPDMPRILPG
jgi:hypothetical protein